MNVGQRRDDLHIVSIKFINHTKTFQVHRLVMNIGLASSAFLKPHDP